MDVSNPSSMENQNLKTGNKQETCTENKLEEDLIHVNLIEKDRNSIRCNTSLSSSEFSYLHLLLYKNPPLKVKLSKLSTLNILIYLEEGFSKNDKFVHTHLSKIKKELINRNDLFDSILKYLHNKSVRDDLYYWTPGRNISNIFSFITEICPEFVEKYKKYYIECLVCHREFYNLLQFVKERYPNDYDQFSTINTDASIFKQCITANIWTDEECGTAEYKSNGDVVYFNGNKVSVDYYVEQILNIREKIHFSDDIEASVVPDVCFVEIVVNDNMMTVSLGAFIGLMTKNLKYRPYWEERGISYDDTNLISC